MTMERCHGPLEGNSRSGGQSPALASSSASHGFRDPGQSTSPEPQPHHLKSRNNDTSPTHLAGLWEANRQIKYLKALAKPCSSAQEILMKPLRPLQLLWMQIQSLLFLFSDQSCKTSTSLIIRKPSSLFLIPDNAHSPKSWERKNWKLRLTMTHLLGGWYLCCLLVYRACVVCGPFPGTLLMPLRVQIPVPAAISGVSYTWILTLTCWATVSPNCFSRGTGSWGISSFHTFCANITLSPRNPKSSRTDPGSPVCISLPCWEMPFSVPAIISYQRLASWVRARTLEISLHQTKLQPHHFLEWDFGRIT